MLRVGDIVKVVNKDSAYYNQIGFIERYKSQSCYVDIWVRFDSYNSARAFTEYDLKFFKSVNDKGG